MNSYISREKVILLCLVMAIVMLVGVIAFEQVKIEKLQEWIQTKANSEAPLAMGKGEYTIFQYTDAGWINPIYVTDYYLVGQVLNYQEKGSTGYLPINFYGLRIIDGWVEGDELMQYGYWIPNEFDF